MRIKKQGQLSTAISCVRLKLGNGNCYGCCWVSGWREKRCGTSVRVMVWKGREIGCWESEEMRWWEGVFLGITKIGHWCGILRKFDVWF